MKKTLILALVMLAGMSLFAQEKKKTTENKGHFGFSAGLALPMSDFASTSMQHGGFAKTGFNFTLNGGYLIANRLGIGGNLFYSTYTVNTLPFNNSSLKADHWQYYGIAVGPYIRAVSSPKVTWDFKLFGGMARANYPLFTLENQTLGEDWSSAFTWQLGTDLRYMISKSTYLIADLDYTDMRPTFKILNTGSYDQIIVGMHLGLGLGWRF